MITHLAAKVPAYCAAGHIRSVAQWTTCWKIGWNSPATAAASKAGYFTGHNIVPVLIVAAFVLVLAKAAGRRKAAPAPARSKAPARR